MKPFCTMCHGPHWMVECPRLDHVTHGPPRVFTRAITQQIIAPEHVRRRPLIPAARTPTGPASGAGAASSPSVATPRPRHASLSPKSPPPSARNKGTPPAPSKPASGSPPAARDISTRSKTRITKTKDAPAPSVATPSANALRQKRYRERKKLLAVSKGDQHDPTPT